MFGSKHALYLAIFMEEVCALPVDRVDEHMEQAETSGDTEVCDERVQVVLGSNIVTSRKKSIWDSRLAEPVSLLEIVAQSYLWETNFV